MTSFNAAMSQLRHALQGLVAEQAMLRRELHSIVQQGPSVRRNGVAAGRRVAAQGGGKKRGRAFKFNDQQAADFRRQVEGGKSALALAKELKISLPTMYSTLKRAGWTGRRGRPAGQPSRGARAAGSGGGGAPKRGRPFQFDDQQATDFRRQVEGGKSAAALAKELKVSLPTMYNTLKRVGWNARRGRPAAGAARAPRAMASGGSKKRGRSFKFSGEQAAELRKQVEGGKSALALARELKISLPTMYNTLKRAGWSGRKGRKAKAA